MRRLLCLLGLLVLAGPVGAGEPSIDPATARLPADVWIVIRLAPLDRLDEIGKLLQPYLAKLGEERTLSRMVLEDLPQEYRALVDRTRPFYFTFNEKGTCVVYPSIENEDGELTKIRHGRHAWLRQGMLHVGEKALLTSPRQGEPLAMTAGDLSYVAPTGRLVANLRGKAAEGLKEIGKLEEFQGYEVPRAVRLLAPVLGRVALDSVFGVEDVHASLTLRGKRAEVEAWIRSLPRTPLRSFLTRAGEPSANRLIAYLPDDAFWQIDSCGLASWLDREIAGLLDQAFGEGAGHDLLLVASPAFALEEHLTGHAAGTISMPGLMAMQTRSIHEIKEGAPIEEAIARLRDARVNALLTRLEIPVSIRLALDFARHGETKLHRLRIDSSVPQAAMLLPQLQTCFAAEGRLLFVVQSATAESDLRSLIDTVRRGERREHGHLKAMAGLGMKRHEGLTIDLAALRPAIAVASFALPEVADLLRVFPKRLELSMALTVRDGHIQLEGVIPLFEILDMIAKLAGE